MKIILSRKGFDSSAGGHANPVFPDGSMLSLPIPSSLDSIRYNSLVGPGGKNLLQIIDELDSGAKIAGKGAHADPDLVRGMRPRSNGWLPSLGQIGSAAGHLRNQSIEVGDLFLFYGWFRHTEVKQGHIRFRTDRPGFHAIYGFLEIGDILNVTNRQKLPVWLHEHPHAIDARLAKSTNTIYIARPTSSGTSHQPGAGVFRIRNDLILTKLGLTRSRWALESNIFRHLQISYHTDSAWKEDYFQSYPRAQEYVIHADEQACDWAWDLIRNSEAWDL